MEGALGEGRSWLEAKRDGRARMLGARTVETGCVLLIAMTRHPEGNVSE